MAIKIYEKFAPRANPADGDYPYGSIKNESVPGAKDGTPLDAVWANDYVGFDAALLAAAGIAPSGLADTGEASQRLDAMIKISGSFATATELASKLPPVGSYVTVEDRELGVFLVQAGGTPTGGRVIDAGNGNTAVLQIGHQILIEQWGAKGDWDTTTKTGTDNYPIFAEIIAYIATLSANAGWVGGMMEAEGLRVSSGRGTFGVSQTVDWGSVSVTLAFAGTMQTVFEAIPGFVAATPIFRLGSKAVQKLTKTSKLKDCSFNCGAIDGVRGFEFYGLRDSSKIEDILVTGFTGTAVYSDFAGQLGGAFMSQGVEITNVHAVSFVHTGGVIYDIGGLFESQISVGKALLNSATTAISADIIGYRIGRTECRGVHIESCAAGNLFGTGFNAGIVYENATRCWDTNCTLEGINGPDVVFGHTQASALCYSWLGRHYNPDPVNAPLNKPILVKSANACGFSLINAPATVNTVEFVAGSVNCSGEILSLNGTVAQAKSTVVAFTGGTGNYVTGYATTDNATFTLSANNASSEGYSNGARDLHDQFWSNFLMVAGGYRFRRSSDNAEVFTVVNGAPVANGTAIKLMVNNGTTTSLKDVVLGATDSAGVGFRSLRVAN